MCRRFDSALHHLQADGEIDFVNFPVSVLTPRLRCLTTSIIITQTSLATSASGNSVDES